MLRQISVFIAAIILASCSPEEDLSLVDGGVKAFHQSLDAKQFDEIYESSGSEMKEATDKVSFLKILNVVDRKLGTVKSSKRVGWNNNVNTSGHFVSVVQDTSFAKGKGTENFTFKIDGKRAVLVGYHVNSDTLIFG